MNENVFKVASMLTDKIKVHESRIHPITILQAKMVYESGGGVLGKLTWKPVRTISEALEEAFLYVI